MDQGLGQPGRDSGRRHGQIDRKGEGAAIGASRNSGLCASDLPQEMCRLMPCPATCDVTTHMRGGWGLVRCASFGLGQRSSPVRALPLSVDKQAVLPTMGWQDVALVRLALRREDRPSSFVSKRWVMPTEAEAPPCPACMGNGQCWTCLGSGSVEQRDHTKIDCAACEGTGRCPKCSPRTVPADRG